MIWRSKPLKKRLRSGARSRAERDRGPQLARNGLEVAHERPRVARELLEPLERDAGLGKERGEDVDGLGQRLALARGLAEQAVRVADEVAQLLLVLGERAVDRARVAHQPLHRALVRVEHLEQVAPGAGELRQLPERVVQLLAALLDRVAELLLPDLERPPGLRVVGLHDLVELHLLRDVARPRSGRRPRAGAPLREPGVISTNVSPSSVLRRRSRGRRGRAGRTWRRSSSVASVRPVSALEAGLAHRADRDPRRAHVDVLRQARRASGNATFAWYPSAGAAPARRSSSQRKNRMQKHENAKATIAASRGGRSLLDQSAAELRVGEDGA